MSEGIKKYSTNRNHVFNVLNTVNKPEVTGP